MAADVPNLTDNGDASKTITWAMNTTSALTTQNVILSGGAAQLRWRPVNVSWSQVSQFTNNGTLDANASAGLDGVELRADPTNHVPDGDFTTSGPWAYLNGSTQQVNASWDPSFHDAVLGHSSASTQIMWDTLDDFSGNWSIAGHGVGSTSSLWPVSGGNQLEGTSAMGDNVTLGQGPDAFAGAQRGGSVDWSSFDRLVVWVYLNASAPLSFNVSAFGPDFKYHYTTSQPLSVDWQELTVNLDQLGTAAIRASLTQVTLRINGENVPARSVWFDAIRGGVAKVFSDTASISQSLAKPNATSSGPGTAWLGFDWQLVNDSGVVGWSAEVNLSGPGGVYERSIPATPVATWSAFLADVSSVTAGSGTCWINISVDVQANTTAPIDARLRVDNVSLTFPNRHDGAYVSNPISLGSESQYLNLTWSASFESDTSATLSLRTGNNTAPGSSGWSSWDSWSAPAKTPLSLPPNMYFQMRADLRTTNQSASPVLRSILLETRQREPLGTIESDVFTIPSDPQLLRWRTLNASKTTGPSSSISFSVGSGSFWTTVIPGEMIPLGLGRSIQWRAMLTTSNGVVTPLLTRVDLVYEYLGPIVSVAVSPSLKVRLVSGQGFQFNATALDAGLHPVPGAVFVWSTNDPEGHVYPNGTYVAGRPGNWTVVATVQGAVISGYGYVNVSSAHSPPPQSIPPEDWPYWSYVLAVLGAAVLGFALYEVWVRRIFAIDDVFLISKDGRLIMHNTRRMRADRDEDILTGMLTAILAFIKDSDPEENGELKRFEVGGKTTLLERGSHVYVTAVYSGRVPGWAPRDLRRFVRDLERRFGEAFAKWNGAPEDLQGLKEYTDRFVSRIRYRGPPGSNGNAG